jgi:acyl-CoA synthetase (AMP-forming)/AMP-acid ligase II
VNPNGPTAHRAITFAELNADSDAIAHGLSASGITRGTRTVLMVPPSPDFFALTFALFKVGAVPVLIDPGMGVKNLGKCLAEAQPEVFIGIAKAHTARRLLGWGRKTIRTSVNVSRWRFFCHSSLNRLRKRGRARGAYPVPDSTETEPAAILFTSGSTGPAKGALYTHGIFAAQIQLLKVTYGIEPGEIDLCTFPLFALFGPALGMTCVLPDMNPTRPARIDPLKALSQIRQFGVTNLFGSPAVIRRMGELVVARRTPALRPGADPTPGTSAAPPTSRSGFATLRRVISAGAPASPAALERFVRLLPSGTEVFTPYGATEALPVANIGSSEILLETRPLTEQGRGVCVGHPVAGVTVSVIRITDEAIPEWDDSLLAPPGAVGEFVVRGPVVTRQYYNRPEATRFAKIRDPQTGEVLHRMGDVGYLDERGRLWFCGRKAHRVVTPHGTLFTDMVEPIFNALDRVARTALVGVMRGGTTHAVLCWEAVPSDSSLPRRLLDQTTQAILMARALHHKHTRLIAEFLKYPGTFPVDVRHNSKIFREKLAVWADRKLGRKWNPNASPEAQA